MLPCTQRVWDSVMAPRHLPSSVIIFLLINTSPASFLHVKYLSLRSLIGSPLVWQATMCSRWGRDGQETGPRWLNITSAASRPRCIAALRQPLWFGYWMLRLLNDPSLGQLGLWDCWWIKYNTKAPHSWKPAWPFAGRLPAAWTRAVKKQHAGVWVVHSVCPFSDPCPLCADDNSAEDVLRWPKLRPVAL